MIMDKDTKDIICEINNIKWWWGDEYSFYVTENKLLSG